MTPAPSGDQIELTHGRHRAVVVTVGAGIRVLEADGQAVLDTYSEASRCDGARGQLLLPWPNRIEHARYRFAGRTEQLAVTEVGTGCAIHGLTRWENWVCTDRHSDEVTLRHRLHPRPGWSGVLDLRVTYRLDDAGLEVRVHAHNVGDTDVPFGTGAHPYLSVGTGPVDDWTLELDASTMLTTDDLGLPTDRIDVAGSAFDFRGGRRIGDTVLDNPFTRLGRDADGRAWVHLHAMSGRRVSLWADANHRWFQIFTGDHLADPARRRRALAVEPMSCPPNAFRTGEDLISLAPDDAVTVTWGIQVTSCRVRYR